jgi:chemotaxis family two-component system response regulator Rcp1
VLLVEDNEMDVFVIREALDRCGRNVDVRVVKDGEQALRYLQDVAEDVKSACPALILIDLNLPKVSGIEVLAKLRRCSRCNRTPVIVVSSSDSESDRSAAAALGADAYFRKPNNLAAYMELTEVIKRVMPTSQAGDTGA